jgi:hypothetical protein
MTKKIRVGGFVNIPVGTRVSKNGLTTKRTIATTVKVLDLDYTAAGKPKVFWKSHGYRASAVLG